MLSPPTHAALPLTSVNKYLQIQVSLKKKTIFCIKYNFLKNIPFKIKLTNFVKEKTVSHSLFVG